MTAGDFDKILRDVGSRETACSNVVVGEFIAEFAVPGVLQCSRNNRYSGQDEVQRH